MSPLTSLTSKNNGLLPTNRTPTWEEPLPDENVDTSNQAESIENCHER